MVRLAVALRSPLELTKRVRAPSISEADSTSRPTASWGVYRVALPTPSGWLAA